jgi:hypothetical protein
MDRNDLTNEQAREVCKVIERYQRYLVRLRTRMEKRGFPATDRTYVNVCRAFDAIQTLRMDLHYLACGGTYERDSPAPESNSDSAST